MIAEENKQKRHRAALVHLLFDFQLLSGMGINKDSREPFAQRRRLRKKTVMQSTPQSATLAQPAQPPAANGTRTRGDLLYQVMTIAAMLIVLVSVWVF
jgi:hypothetical protein